MKLVSWLVAVTIYTRRVTKVSLQEFVILSKSYDDIERLGKINAFCYFGLKAITHRLTLRTIAALILTNRWLCYRASGSWMARKLWAKRTRDIYVQDKQKQTWWFGWWLHQKHWWLKQTARILGDRTHSLSSALFH